MESHALFRIRPQNQINTVLLLVLEEIQDICQPPLILEHLSIRGNVKLDELLSSIPIHNYIYCVKISCTEPCRAWSVYPPVAVGALHIKRGGYQIPRRARPQIS